MDHFVKLERLPDGVRFPTDLRDRIEHDPAAGRLIFHGFMSKCEFDRLWLVSEDWSYRRQLEELFRLCTPEDEARPRGLRRLFAAWAGLGVALVAVAAWWARASLVG